VDEEERHLLYIAEAGKKGRGVFARRHISRGVVVICFRGKEEWIWDIARTDWEYTLQVDYDRYVLPQRGSPGWFLNHSCDPNCVLDGRLEVKSWRRIERGEELTIDYSTDVGWDGFEMVCHCGSENCRGLIRSYAFLPGELKEKYGQNVAPFLLERRA
jgi:SET domain-containing protein